MQCPRCSSDNSDNRCSCWKCFAPLEAAPSSPTIIAPKAPEPVQASAAPLGDQTSWMNTPASTDGAADAATIDQSKYVVPGLADLSAEPAAAGDADEDHSPWKNNPSAAQPAGKPASAAASGANKGRKPLLIVGLVVLFVVLAGVVVKFVLLRPAADNTSPNGPQAQPGYGMKGPNSMPSQMPGMKSGPGPQGMPGQPSAMKGPGQMPAMKGPGQMPGMKGPGQMPAMKGPGQMPMMKGPGAMRKGMGGK